MRTGKILLALGALMLVGNLARADAPLKTKLGLDVDQASQVQVIQKRYRKQFNAKRQVFNRENRKLRRARSDNDSEQIAKQETVTAGLREELKKIRRAENDEIRAVLNPEQQSKFADVIAQRRASVGSSRDADIFKD